MGVKLPDLVDKAYLSLIGGISILELLHDDELCRLQHMLHEAITGQKGSETDDAILRSIVSYIDDYKDGQA
jgi:hypothetical protein